MSLADTYTHVPAMMYVRLILNNKIVKTQAARSNLPNRRNLYLLLCDVRAYLMHFTKKEQTNFNFQPPQI